MGHIGERRCPVHYVVLKGFLWPKKRGFGFADEVITIVMLLRVHILKRARPRFMISFRTESRGRSGRLRCAALSKPDAVGVQFQARSQPYLGAANICYTVAPGHCCLRLQGKAGDSGFLYDHIYDASFTRSHCSILRSLVSNLNRQDSAIISLVSICRPV